VRLPAIPLLRMAELYSEGHGVEEDLREMFAGVELWSMVQFDGISSQRVLERLRNTTCCEDLPGEEAPGLDEPSCVATLDCDDPEGCLGHSVDGDPEGEEGGQAPECRQDWKALHRAFDDLSDTSDVKYDACHSEDLTWGLSRRPDPFDPPYGIWRMGYRPLRAFPSGGLETYRDDTGEILGDFSLTETIERSG